MENKVKEADGLLNALERYRLDISLELAKTCQHIIKIIDEDVIPNKHHIKGAEAIVFFKKMVADFNRYLCEFGDEEENKQYRDSA